MWIAFTMTMGALFGEIYVGVFRRKKPATATGSQPTAGA